MINSLNVEKVTEPQFLSRVKSIVERGKMGSFIDISSFLNYEMCAYAENGALNESETVKYGLLIAESSSKQFFSSPMAVSHAIQALRVRALGSINISGIRIVNDDVYHQIIEERQTLNAAKGDKLRSLISMAQEADTSDIHLYLTPDHAKIQFRIQGRLWTYYDSYARVDMDIILRELFFSTSSSGYSNTRFEFDKTLDFKSSVMSLNGDYTVNIRYHHSACDKGRVDVTMRLAPVKNTAVTHENKPLETFGYLRDQAKIIDTATLAINGMVTLAGVTGSGKTTTIINQLIYKYKMRNGQIKLVSIEDPVEAILPFMRSKDINATRVTKAIDEKRQPTDTEKLTTAIKDIGREDCDGVLLGEIRTAEAAIAGVNLADTGQHIMTTIHTRNNLGVYEKLLNLGCPKDIIFKPDFFAALVYQELVQRLCNDCKLTIEEAINYSNYGHKMWVNPSNGRVSTEKNHVVNGQSGFTFIDDFGHELFFSLDHGFYTEPDVPAKLEQRLKVNGDIIVDSELISELKISDNGYIVTPDGSFVLIFPVHQRGYTGAYNEEGRPILTKSLLNVIDQRLSKFKSKLRLRDPRAHHPNSSSDFEPMGCKTCESGRKSLTQPNSNKINVGYRGLSKPGQTVAAEVLQPTSKLLNILSTSLSSGIEYYSTLYRLEGRHTVDGLTSTEHAFHKVLKGEVCIDFFNEKYDLSKFLDNCSDIEDQINLDLKKMNIVINNGNGFQMLDYLDDVNLLTKWQKEYRSQLAG
jgi:type II secretory ATPase GspE/PulE/Tfp pilus assembly ATPase PilB-like protein